MGETPPADPPPGQVAPAGESPDSAPGGVLSDEDRAILAFEKRWWRRPGAKERAIGDTFDMTVTGYLQRLNALLDDPAAQAAEPEVVRRLRRAREERHRLR